MRGRVDLLFCLGANREDTLRIFAKMGLVGGMLQDLHDAERARVLGALWATMVEHDAGHGALHGSGARPITARRPARERRPA